MSKKLQITNVIPTGDHSDYAYGMAVFNGALYTAFNDNTSGNNGKMRVRSYVGLTRNGLNHDDNSSHIKTGSKTPALCAYGTSTVGLYLANRDSASGGNNEDVEFCKQRTETDWDDDCFNSTQMNGVTPRTDKGPAMVTYNGQMHAILKQNTHHLIKHCWFDGSKWHWYNQNDRNAILYSGSSSDRDDFDTWHDDDDHSKYYLQTEQSPAVAVEGNKLVLAFKNCGGRSGIKPIVTAEYDGSVWSNDEVVKDGNNEITVDKGPALAYFKGNLWLVYVDHSNNHLKCIRRDSNGNWHSSHSIDNSLVPTASLTADSPPRLAPFTLNGEDCLALSFADSNGVVQLYYLNELNS